MEYLKTLGRKWIKPALKVEKIRMRNTHRYINVPDTDRKEKKMADQSKNHEEYEICNIRTRSKKE